jgi:integrase
VGKFLKANEHDQFIIAWHLALAGLRRGEIAGLRKDCVDLEAMTLTIDETRVSVSGKPQKRTPKTETSVRTLPIPDPLLRALKHQFDIQSTMAIVKGNKYQDSGYVVTDSRGQQVLPDRLSRTWSQACDTAKVPKIRLHDARPHTRNLDASAGRPNRGDRSLAGSRRCGLHKADICPLAASLFLQLAAQSFADL